MGPCGLGRTLLYMSDVNLDDDDDDDDDDDKQHNIRLSLNMI